MRFPSEMATLDVHDIPADYESSLQTDSGSDWDYHSILVSESIRNIVQVSAGVSAAVHRYNQQAKIVVGEARLTAMQMQLVEAVFGEVPSALNRR